MPTGLYTAADLAPAPEPPSPQSTRQTGLYSVNDLATPAEGPGASKPGGATSQVGTTADGHLVVGDLDAGASGVTPQIDPRLQQKGVGDFLTRALPDSAGNLLGNVVDAVSHPINTVAGVADLAMGGMENLADKITGHARPTQETAMADALGKMYKDRYGSPDQIKNTVYNDPAGVAADLATIFGGAGAAAKGVELGADAANFSRVAGAAGTVARVAGQASDLVDPLRVPGRVAGAVAKIPAVASGLDAIPQGLYHSSLKPPPSTPGTAAMVQTGLENGIPVSASGVSKLTDLMDNLNNKIKAVIANGKQRGVTIDPNAVAQRVDQIRPGFANQVNPDKDLQMIDNSKAEFLRNQGQTPGSPAVAPKPTGLLDPNGRPILTAGTPATPGTPAQPIPADTAQAMKQNTYKQLSYGELKNGQVEAQKALARGLKEEIANQFPEISALNAKDSKLLDLQPTLERAVQRYANHNAVGIGPAVVGEAGGRMLGVPGAGLGIGALKMALDNPAVKSHIAIMLYRAGQMSGKATGAVSRAKVTNIADALARVQAVADSLPAGQRPGQQTDSTQSSPPEGGLVPSLAQ